MARVLKISEETGMMGKGDGGQGRGAELKTRNTKVGMGTGTVLKTRYFLQIFLLKSFGRKVLHKLRRNERTIYSSSLIKCIGDFFSRTEIGEKLFFQQRTKTRPFL